MQSAKVRSALGRTIFCGIGLCFLGMMSACVGPAPKHDYSLAKTALDSARAAKADRYAPGYLGEAEEAYRHALADYEDRDYKDAKDGFTKARLLAEKAETFTAIKKAESGEGP